MGAQRELRGFSGESVCQTIRGDRCISSAQAVDQIERSIAVLAMLVVRCSRLLEVGLLPDPVGQVAGHLADVVLGRSGMPTTGEPAAGAAPGIPCDVRTAALHVVQPALVSLEAGPPDGIGGVGV